MFKQAIFVSLFLEKKKNISAALYVAAINIEGMDEAINYEY